MSHPGRSVGLSCPSHAEADLLLGRREEDVGGGRRRKEEGGGWSGGPDGWLPRWVTSLDGRYHRRHHHRHRQRCHLGPIGIRLPFEESRPHRPNSVCRLVSSMVLMPPPTEVWVHCPLCGIRLTRENIDTPTPGHDACCVPQRAWRPQMWRSVLRWCWGYFVQRLAGSHRGREHHGRCTPIKMISYQV